jgi:hypothetical protein
MLAPHMQGHDAVGLEPPAGNEIDQEQHHGRKEEEVVRIARTL